MSSTPHTVYKNVVFDIGNVLLTWNPHSFVLDLFHDSIENEEERKSFANEIVKLTGHCEMWKNLDRGLISYDEAIEEVDSVSKELELKHMSKERFERFLRNVHLYFPPIPLGVQILTQVKSKGYRCFVLSNFMRDMFEKVSARNHEKIFSLMDGLTVSAYHGVAKPERAIYEKLLSQHNLKAEECIFIDDILVNVDAAKQVGIHAILCDSHENVLRELKTIGIL